MAEYRRGPGDPETRERNKLTVAALPAGPLELSVEEVRQLWSFIHGDIMDGNMRRLLRASLGLCPRHTWAYAVVEIELWQAGAGARGGHQPFDVTVLYEDLLDHVADGLDRKSSLLHRHPDEVLLPAGPCRICQDMASPDLPGLRMGYANSNTEALTVEANGLAHTTAGGKHSRFGGTGYVPTVSPAQRKEPVIRRCCAVSIWRHAVPCRSSCGTRWRRGCGKSGEG